jgi:Zn-dependent M32 family carboxypeptidase
VVQDPYQLLDAPRKALVNSALQHVNLSDAQCGELANYASWNANRIKFYYFEESGPWAKSRLDKTADPYDTQSFNEFRLASKSFNDTRQLTLTLLHEAFHLLYKLDNSHEFDAESTAQRCYLP